MKKIFIGTSGWVYDHWWGNFYPNTLKDEERLIYYSSHFDTVEINNTFYHMPQVKTVENWAAKTPKKFLFSVKASRFITHIKRLNDCANSVQYLYDTLVHLKDKLGPIFFQLPPNFPINLERLDSFLQLLDPKQKHLFEFRNESWFIDETYELLKKYNVGLCIYHLDRFLSPIVVTADFAYLRLHGPKGAYQGLYKKRELAEWAERFLQWQSEGKEVYCYFDNDQRAYAVKNALELKKALEA